MAKITIKEEGPLVGIWLQSKKGLLALIADDRMRPYIAFYPEGNKGIPCALCIDENNELRLQTAGDNPGDVQLLPLEKLIEALSDKS